MQNKNYLSIFNTVITVIVLIVSAVTYVEKQNTVNSKDIALIRQEMEQANKNLIEIKTIVSSHIEKQNTINFDFERRLTVMEALQLQKTNSTDNTRISYLGK
ncbi:MAG: hypothetical protein V4538_02315 [Bacteroidota bacterium]